MDWFGLDFAKFVPLARSSFSSPLLSVSSQLYMSMLFVLVLTYHKTQPGLVATTSYVRGFSVHLNYRQHSHFLKPCGGWS